ncbi:MAG: BrnT family toxin [Deltaproteobacteria bacterium]|nr:BrnT family toxin [Deltaproteobacteria bacterium]
MVFRQPLRPGELKRSKSYIHLVDKWYNNRKSKSNKKKHGIDFFEAQALWDDPDRIVIPAETIDEPRCIVIGQINQKSWSAIVTYRNDKIRIISIRRARMEEVEIYES